MSLGTSARTSSTFAKVRAVDALCPPRTIFVARVFRLRSSCSVVKSLHFPFSLTIVELAPASRINNKSGSKDDKF